MSAPLPVLHITIDAPGGATGYVQRLVAAADRTAVAPTVALLPLPGFDGPSVAGMFPASVVALPRLAGLRGLAAALAATVPIARRAAVVVTHTGPAGLVGRLAAAVAGRPCVHVAHNWPGETPGRSLRRVVLGLLDRGLAPLADRVVAPSQAILDIGDERGWVRPGRGLVIRYALDLPALTARLAPDRAAARARLGLPVDVPLIVAAGRLDPIKGLDVLARAAAALPPGVRVLIAGDGAQRALLSGSRAEVLGWRDDVPLLFQAADIVAVPSRLEALGIVCLEAMAAGTPVVASRTGGIPEALGEAGVLVPREDPAALAVALRGLLDDAPRCAALAERGRRRVLAEFSGDAWVRRYEALWLGLAGAAR